MNNNHFAHGYMMDSWNYSHGTSVWDWLFMFLMMTLLVLGVILVVRLVSSGKGSSTSSAIETLKNRYAKGEITKKQYEEMKEDIE